MDVWLVRNVVSFLLAEDILPLLAAEASRSYLVSERLPHYTVVNEILRSYHTLGLSC